MSWGESPIAYRLIKRTARKGHRCCECRGVIKKGERYNYHSGVWEGEPQAFKVCVDCNDLRDRVIKEQSVRNHLQRIAEDGIIEMKRDGRLVTFRAKKGTP